MFFFYNFFNIFFKGSVLLKSVAEFLIIYYIVISFLFYFKNSFIIYHIEYEMIYYIVISSLF